MSARGGATAAESARESREPYRGGKIDALRRRVAWLETTLDELTEIALGLGLIADAYQGGPHGRTLWGPSPWFVLNEEQARRRDCLSALDALTGLRDVRDKLRAELAALEAEARAP